jgi:hypothetical protein
MTADDKRKLWSDHSNPLVAEAEKRLTLAGTMALQKLAAALARDYGLPLGERNKEGTEHARERSKDAGR